MRIAIVGYGKMGKEIERLALARGWSVDLRIDIDTPPPSPAQRKAVDVVVYFANTGDIVSDLTPWAEAGRAIVVGTTGWQKDLPKVEAMAAANRIGLIHSSNFSIGVNVFYQLVRKAAELFDRFDGYDAFIHETHHNKKLDSPSGTALTIGQIVLRHLRRKKELLTEPAHGAIRPEQLHVSSTRTGTIAGIHVLGFDSASDTIELTHTSKDRSGLALGALLAAEWIAGKHGIFTMDDVFQDLFTNGAR